MPRRQPFTALCQLLARRPGLDRADLHLHSTSSDGTYTPKQVVEIAARCGLAAIALTDHDTLAGIAPARAAAVGTALEIIPAVEITAEQAGRELHLLAYFVRPEDEALQRLFYTLQQDRRQRFLGMVERLRARGVIVNNVESTLDKTLSPGRRHLAELLVRCRHVGSVREAFQRYLRDGGPADVPKCRVPAAEALSAVRAAGGVASWAHPPEHLTAQNLAPLVKSGLGAIEIEYPGFREGRRKELRTLAQNFSLAITGGSDCHGPDEPRRGIGACTISRDDLERLRQHPSRGPS